MAAAVHGGGSRYLVASFLLFKAYLSLFAVFAAYHCVFHILYLKTAAPVYGWAVALRYTLATMAAAFLLPGLLFLVPLKLSWLKRAALWLMGIILFFCAMVLIGDLAYYRQAGKHATVEFLLLYQNFTDIALMAFRDYFYVPLLYLALAVIFFVFWRRLVRSYIPNAVVPMGRGALVRGLGIVIVFVLLHVIAFRGGFQGRPLRPADAFQHLTQAQGDFALNGVYTAFYAIFNAAEFPAHADRESIAAVQNMLRGKNEKFVSDALPFYRTVVGETKPIKKNVVFIILESWSARRLGIFGDKTGATPFFDSLAAKGLFFTRAFATGRRSIASLPSALSSIPTLFGSLYITSPHEQNFQRGMGSIFSAQGYSTAFTYAAKAGSMGFNAFARLAGFDKITTRESFPADAPHDGTWGIYDHVMFERVLADFDAAPKPALSVVYTLHPHPPFTLPDQPRAGYYNALRYSDGTLRDFFSAAEKKPWFRDTVFVLMADHAFEDVQGYDAFHIPLLFYAPGFIAAKKDTTVASELDVLPTLVDLLQLNTTHAAMGKSLFAGDPHFAFIDIEYAAGLIREKNSRLLAVFFDPEKYRGYFDMENDREWHTQKNEAAFSPAELRSMRAYIDVMGHAVANNKIAPRPR